MDLTRPLVKYSILLLLAVLAFSVRQFSVIRFEVVIHEFDPYFNYRSTAYLIKHGFYSFLNWFDSESWYPLGRIVGSTVFPGIMWTAAAFYHVLDALNLTLTPVEICVFLAPFFAGLTSFATFLLTREMHGSDGEGLFAAAFMAFVPGYISRSVAGSYDNEGVAIFALIFTFYLWVRAVRKGTILSAVFAAIAYFYMVAAWGGYIFIINLVPLYVMTMIVTGRFSSRLYVAYSVFFTVGSFLAMQITFVGYNQVQTSEHMAAIGTFIFVQLLAAFKLGRFFFTVDVSYLRFVKAIATVLAVLVTGAITVASATGYISPFSGRFYSLLDPTHAKDHVPIIASISEHQPTAWSSYVFDLHMLTFLLPAGLYYCFKNLNDSNIFVILYATTIVYFSGVMVRLMLVLAPVASIMGGVAVSQIFKAHIPNLIMSEGQKEEKDMSGKSKAKKAAAEEVKELSSQRRLYSIVIVGGMALLLFMFVSHSVWVTSEAYSSPSIILSAKQPDGSRVIFDDFREAYYWIRDNTKQDAKVMSWWDYGYQMAELANRTTIVDNNTWNNTHIATVGKAFALNEEGAAEILRDLDVDYVLVLFGGMSGYASDDINKFLWMVRIAGGVDPAIKEADYYSNGQFRVDANASKTMKESVMYKLCYYRFGEQRTDHRMPAGYDRVRHVEVGDKNIKLKYFEEAYTSRHWLSRVFKVRRDLLPPRDD
eukprot:TRINITY_DN3696_c0_g1_i1.p1 TRINITY_DN3696_c0_g1~~TRINITY_DN3696_c0_g1_i1.p1  ORF type:complete len:707 (+),score=174.40 TRINITY_DN3696_c0_g1_i1:84-2204(+)